MRLIGAILVLAAASCWGGCALSRSEQLARQSDRVEAKLVRERDGLIGGKANAADAPARLDHLNNLRTQLTVADAARKLAPRLLKDPTQVDAAYDVLEEVYSTIDWNIPLMPGAQTWKAMPPLFGPAGLDFSRLAPGIKP